MSEPDLTRKLLKTFGIKVTDFDERSRELLQRAQAAGKSAEQREVILKEAAELTAELHQALREITLHVYQLQSNLLMQLVAKEEARPDSG